MNDHILHNAINIIRNLQEDGAMGGSPTNSVGTGGFTSSADPKGPVAGYDTKMMKKGRKYMKGPGRKVWLDYLKSSNGRRN